MEAHVGDRIVVHSTHQGEPERTGEVIECHEPDGGPPYRVRWEPDGHTALFYPAGTAGRRPPRPLAQLRGRTHGEGHRDGAGTAVRRRKCATWPSSATRARGRPPSPRPCSSPPARCRGPAASRTARPASTPRRSRSASSARCRSGVATVEHAGHRITLLDTPGSPDFVGELRAGLRAADAALFVVSAVNGVDATTVQLWEECAAVGMPRAVVITQLDRARADVDDAVRLCQTHAGGGASTRCTWSTAGPDGVGRAGWSRCSSPDVARPGGRPAPRRADRGDHRRERGRGAHGALPRRRRAGPGRPDRRPGDRRRPRATSTRCCCAAPLTGVGIDELLELLVAGFPCPMEHGCPPVTRPDGVAGAAAGVRPRRPAGRRGRQDDDRPLPRPGLAGPRLLRHAAARHPDPRLRPRHGRPRAPRPRRRRADRRDLLAAGRHAAPGRGLPGRGHLRRRPARPAPRPATRCPPRRTRGSCRRGTCPRRSCPVAVEAASRADEDRLATALARLVAEDPTVRLERRPDTGQLLLWCVGEAHAEVLLERLRTRHGVARHHRARARADGRDAGRPAPGHRPARQAVRRARAVRRRRGRGPSPARPAPGSSSSSGSSAARCPASSTAAWRRASGRRPQRGVSGDRPIVDVHVTLVDGKAHSVDSSDAAFQAAGALALRELAAAAGTRVLEPWCEVEVVVPGGVRRGGDERPVRAAGPGHRQRGRPGPRPDDGARRGARGRAADLSRACCARSPTAPAASPAVRSATSRRPSHLAVPA